MTGDHLVDRRAAVYFTPESLEEAEEEKEKVERVEMSEKAGDTERLWQYLAFNHERSASLEKLNLKVKIMKCIGEKSDLPHGPLDELK